MTATNMCSNFGGFRYSSPLKGVVAKVVQRETHPYLLGEEGKFGRE